MKQGRPISEVLTEIKRQSEIKHDYITPAEKCTLADNGETFRFADMEFGTTELFHRQIGSALGIPAKYYDQMRKTKPQLLAYNVNSWFADKEQSYMIRSLDESRCKLARAFLSERYRRIDNLEVASTVLPLFLGMEVVSAAITDQHLYIKVVNHALEAEVVPGDVVQAGVVVSNSEVGLGAVCVYPLIYRLVCKNGMCVPDFGERRAHVGKVANEDFYSAATLEAENKAFLLRLRDAAMAALEEARFKQLVGKLQAASEVKFTGHIKDVVELTAKTYELNQVEQDSILEYLIEGGDLSLYGLGNAITRTSQDVESYERATVLEKVGWQVLNV